LKVTYILGEIPRTNKTKEINWKVWSNCHSELFCFLGYNIADVSEQQVASIFGVEKETRQETSVKATGILLSTAGTRRLRRQNRCWGEKDHLWIHIDRP
jgi:hypothetical protein